MTDAEISDILQSVQDCHPGGRQRESGPPSHGVMAYLLARGY